MAQQKSQKQTQKGKGKQEKSFFFSLTSRVCILLAAALMALSYLSFVVNPAKLWVLSLFGIAFLPLLAANLVLFIWAVVRRSKTFIIPFLAIIPCVFFIGRYVQFSPNEDAEAIAPDLKIVSYNLGRFGLSAETSGIENKEQCADSVFAYLKSQDADIICLQEFYLKKTSVQKYVKRHFPGYHAEYYMFQGKQGSFGNVTLSRIPVSDKGVLKFDGSANLAIYTDHKVGQKRFRVYNCHFESYNISFTGMVKSFVKDAGEAVTEAGTKMKRSILRRPQQVDKVFSNIEKCPHEAFVCGDFNDNPVSYTYYRMTRGREDSFVAAGEGFGATYSRLWPLLRIDYILVPDSFKTITCDVHHIDYSDHYPVVAEIKL